uniref:Uncharacterized protein n=1 Tax=Arion vulgaris TaxID=1028688 RepID=A0A0B6ZJ28_9EUPU
MINFLNFFVFTLPSGNEHLEQAERSMKRKLGGHLLCQAVVKSDVTKLGGNLLCQVKCNQTWWPLVSLTCVKQWSNQL